MAKIFKIQTSFTSGELSPRLLARVDLEQYTNGVKKMENAYPLVHGGAKRRNGSMFVGEVFDSSEPAKLIPYVLSKDVSFMVVINGSRLEFINDDGQYVLNGGSPGGSPPDQRYAIACPYTGVDLEDVKYAQVGLDLYIVHPDYAPRKLTCNDAAGNDWTFVEPTFVNYAVTDFWFENSSITFKILGGTTAFAEGDIFTIATSSTTAVPDGGNTGNGTVFGIEYGPNYPASGTTTLTCVYADADRQEWEVDVTGTSGAEDVAQWYDGNWPASVTSFEQRLYFAGTAEQPQQIVGSQVGQPDVFTVGPNDDDAVSFTIASDRYDRIIHLAPGRFLFAFTVGGEFTIQGGDNGVTPSTVTIRQHTSHGSNDVRPIRIGQEYLFVERGGGKVRAVSYSFAEDVNVAPDITLLADHISAAPTYGFCCAAFAQAPDYVAWYVRTDGSLCSLTHLRDTDSTGWAEHTTDGLFESVATVPNGAVDDVYCTVLRSISDGGSPPSQLAVRYVERFDYTENHHTDCHVDGLTGSPATATWSGLDHLEGKTVKVVADGNVHPDVVVTGGQVELNYAANEVEIGLGYETEIQIQHPEIALSDGTTQGRPISVNEIYLRLDETVGAQVNGVTVPFRVAGDLLGEPIPPFTGDKRVHNLGWSRDEVMTIKQVDPKDFTLLGVILVVNVK